MLSILASLQNGYLVKGYITQLRELSIFYHLDQSPIAELSFVTLTIHLCNGLNDKNLVKPRKTCFLSL